MKKTILFLVILALLVPAAAFAQTEFTLGGFIKLDSFWDSTQAGKNNNLSVGRNNDPNFQHGRLNFTAQGSRFNFTIKGPKVFGAQTTGYIEMDFDGGGTDPVLNSSNAYVPRLRHAMFRFNWPETELLLGQYWSMFCEYYPEMTEDGPLQGRGVPTARLAQIRLTQKFAGAWTVAGFIGQPTQITSANAASVTPTATAAQLLNNAFAGGNVLQNHSLQQNGTSAETPQVQAKVQFQKDLYGQAPFYGRPMPFTAQIVGGWQRNEARNANQGFFAGVAPFQNAFVAQAVSQRDHQYLNPWMLQGTLFIPILPTYSKNLAGSASLTAQYYVGAGLEAFGEANGAGNSFFRFRGIGFNSLGVLGPAYDLELTKRYGGYVQGQYYFNNEWFMNVVWGFDKAFGIPGGRDGTLAAFNGGISPGYVYASLQDQYRMNQEIAGTLWYRPITAIKFGLQYAYSRTDWLQKLSANTPGLPFLLNNNVKDVGEGHRVQFVGFFYF